MKKRLLTVLLAVCLVVALGTVTAAAADDTEIPVAGGALSGDYKLTADTTVSSQLTVADNSTVTIDLNGFTLSSSDTGQCVIANKGNLTIKDMSENATGKISGSGGIINYGALTLESGTIESTASGFCAVQFYEGGDTSTEIGIFTMKGGKLSATSSSIGKMVDNKSATINIFGGDAGNINLLPSFILTIGNTDIDHDSIHVGALKRTWTTNNVHINLYSGIIDSLPSSSNGITYNESPSALIVNNTTVPGGYHYETTTHSGKTYFKLVKDGNPVAHIESEQYYYLPDAVAALKDGDTLVLDADFEVSDASEILKFTASNVTLDLNGHDITSLAPSSPVVCSGAASGTFTITNSSKTSTNASIIPAQPDEDHSYKIAAVSVGSNSSVTLNIEGNVTLDGVRLSSGGRIADTADNRKLLSYDGSMDNLYAVTIGSEAYIYGGGNISAIGLDAENKGINKVTATLLGDADDGITYGNSDVALTVELDGNEVTGVGNAAVGIPSGANGTSLTVQNGTVHGQISAAGASSEECTLTLINLDMTSNGDAGVAANGALSDGLELTLKDCTLRSTNNNNMTTGIFFPVDGGVLTIDNSTITGYNTGVQAYAGSVTIKGAGTEITGSGVSVLNPDKEGKPATTGPIFDGSAISIIDRITEYGGFGSITIEDGSFSTETGSGGENGAVHVASEVEPGSFGDFNNSKGDGTKIVQVSGGTFTSSVSEYVTDELKAELYSAANGTYTYYSSEEAASANAKPGDIISDVKETVEYNVRVVYGNGTADTLATVKNKATFILPDTPTRNGYTFGGWRSGNTVYKAGETVKVTSDMTFTAIWNAINIPDTYDIEIADTANGEVDTSLSNASAGSTITITATPDSGYSVASVTVTGPDGRVDVVRVNATTYTFKMPAGDVTVRVTFTDSDALPFTDVSAGQWFYDAVAYVYTNGMMEGDSATTFNPDGTMTRAMFWAVLGRIDGATITGTNWADQARDWAMAEGVSDGTDPNGLVTREQMVTMLWRYAVAKGYDVSIGESTNILSYADFGQISEYAIPAMQWGCGSGVITGMTDTTLVPQGTATRAQCAAIFMRFDQM